MKSETALTGTHADAIHAIVSAVNAADEFIVTLRFSEAALPFDPCAANSYLVRSMPRAIGSGQESKVREVYCIACAGRVAAWIVRNGPALAQAPR